MCGYQCDKAVNKNDTREVKWYHITSRVWIVQSNRLEQFGWTNWLERYILDFSWRLASNLAGGTALAGRIALQSYQRFPVLQLGGLIFLSM